MEVLTAVLMKLHVFWDIVLCQQVNANADDEGTTFL